ncbi:EamA family transporter [Pseudomonas capeferrum]|uniref:EamA family transporter n=1 Tax=Pseudomonas capeferrum TaxID=1495066 RepID=UPI0015E3710B|nr:EamA family transporter [Pseudomonas capeferrum]MBA1200929.1 EamA family transporter [Pseudomonas capeferrum]
MFNLLVKVKQPKAMLVFMIWTSLFAVPAMVLLIRSVKGVQSFKLLMDGLTWQAGISILFQSYVTTMAGYAIWNNLMKKYPATSVAPLSLLVPVSGMLASVLFFDDVLPLHRIFALGLVLVGRGVFLNATSLAYLLKRTCR